MATPWDRITDDSYRQWLVNRQVSADEFNEIPVLERSDLRTRFEQQQQQPNGKLRCCFLYSFIEMMLLRIRKFSRARILRLAQTVINSRLLRNCICYGMSSADMINLLRC